MFNIQGSELIFLLLIALLVLGPEKLPDAIRKFTRTYAEFKKVAGGFQGELRQVLDEPMRELRETADAVRQAAVFDPDAPVDEEGAPSTRPAPAVSEIAPRKRGGGNREASLNFGNPAARRAAARQADDADVAAAEPEADAAETAGEADSPATAAEVEDAAE